MISRRHLIALAPAFALAPRLAFAQGAVEPGAFVSEFAQKGIVDILAAKIANAEKQTRFRSMFTTSFDLPSIGRFVLGRYARTVKPEDLSAFQPLFEDVIVYTWSRRFSEYNGQTLKVGASTPDGDEGAIVKSTIVGNAGENFAVDWRLRKRPDGWKIVDVIVAGVSMAITYRQEYTTLIAQQGGFPGLITQLQKQVGDLKAAQPA
ncbi:MAG: ABC transporter substrate-binding protein [Proteobacteria bacterium]|nr:ABC transporter substrate-binding protein [Pseudomonadota bacterium]